MGCVDYDSMYFSFLNVIIMCGVDRFIFKLVVKSWMNGLEVGLLLYMFSIFGNF